MGCHETNSGSNRHNHHSRSRACVLCIIVCAVCSVNLHLCKGHQQPNGVHILSENLLKLDKQDLSRGDSMYEAGNLGGKTKRDAAEKTDMPDGQTTATPDDSDNDYKQEEITKKNYTAVILHQLFQKYGTGDKMTFEGFEHLLENLGLGDIKIDHSLEPHKSWNWIESVHKNHHHSVDHDHAEQELEVNIVETTSRGYVATADTIGPNEDEIDMSVMHSPGSAEYTGRQRRSNISNGLKACLPPAKLLSLHRVNITFLSMENFVAICPSLIYQLDDHLCPHPSHDSIHDHAHDHQRNKTEFVQPAWQSPSAEVWGYSLLACLIISAVGLLCVCIIPIMHKVVYNHVLQFLVALAIGSMTGDALLHLLPHAFLPDPDHSAHAHGNSSDYDNDHHDTAHEMHDRIVWMGLTSLTGIYIFFIIEQLVKICSERRSTDRIKLDVYEQKASKDMPLSATATSQLQSSQLLSAVEANENSNNVRVAMALPTKEPKQDIGARLAKQGANSASCEEMITFVHTNKDVRMLSKTAHDEVHRHCDPAVKDDSWNDGGHKREGHNHSHRVPGSVSSVAWMVIFGDGFHNFADGLAIGSAFASSLTGGLSTSIAVLCHELPHELGDFAMLMNAGMTAKQALIYNCVSSILCLFGMLVGVLVGNLRSADSWIFAVIAGLFLYIALVDMLPEMKSVRPKTGEHPFVHLALQIIGMLAGASIMLIIALFEDSIQVMP